MFTAQVDHLVEGNLESLSKDEELVSGCHAVASDGDLSVIIPVGLFSCMGTEPGFAGRNPLASATPPRVAPATGRETSLAGTGTGARE